MRRIAIFGYLFLGLAALAAVADARVPAGSPSSDDDFANGRAYVTLRNGPAGR